MRFEDIQTSLLLHPRFKHSLGVMKMALKLNEIHQLNVDEEKIKFASLLHDVTKTMDIDEQIELILTSYPEVVNEELYKSLPVVHSFSGSVIAKYQYNILDLDILNAIFYHTTGRKEMSNLEKLIFLSDYIEEGRSGENFSEVREIAYNNIDEAILRMYELNFKYLESKKTHIHSFSIEAYEYYKGGKKC